MVDKKKTKIKSNLMAFDIIDISIIIVNYKSWTHLEQCLLSIKKIDTDKVKFEVVIVDNCSNDKRLQNFSEKFSNFSFILNSGNNGFSNGCNLGANASKGEFLLFLNPDTIISEKVLMELLNTGKKHSNYKLISCNKITPKGKYERIDKPFPSLLNLFGLSRAIHEKFNKTGKVLKSENENEIVFPYWISGSLVLMSRQWFEVLGGWNEDYWMYYEDVDLCKRTTRLNGKVALILNQSIIHNHGGASRSNMQTAALTKSEVLISRHVYIMNNFNGFIRVLLQVLLVLNNLIIKFFSAILGIFFFFIPKLRVFIYLYINIIKYYISALYNGTWLSVRSMNYKKNKLAKV